MDDLKKLSDLSWKLLEKGAIYQNDIKKSKLYLGGPGTIFTKVNYEFWLSNAQIKHFSFNYQFYDMEEQKIRDCAIYSPYNHFSERGFRFKLYNNIYTVGLGEFANSIFTQDTFLILTYIIKPEINFLCLIKLLMNLLVATVITIW